MINEYEQITLLSEARIEGRPPSQTLTRLAVHRSFFTDGDLPSALRADVMASLRRARDEFVAKRGEDAAGAEWQEDWYVGNTEDSARAFIENRMPRRLDW